MRIRKHPLLSERIRCPPKEGFSWIDRRFLRDYADVIGRDAILLYFFLCAVSDKEGLSYYSTPGIVSRLKMAEATVALARDELEFHDLILYRSPLYQVLSLPERTLRCNSSGPALLGDILRQLATGSPRRPNHFKRNERGDENA
jgi:hypothetical protein